MDNPTHLSRPQLDNCAQLDDILSFIRLHKNKNYIEIEFRLGKKGNSNAFDTNVGEDIFSKALSALNGYRAWESVTEKKEQVFYGARNGLRIVYNESTDEQVCVTKHQLGVKDYVIPNSRFDVRIAASTEIPSNYDNERDRFPTVKNRRRISYVRKGLSIDVSEITTTGEQEDKDEESQTQYQIEFEILDPKEIDDNRAFNHFQKVFDLLKCFS